MGVLTNILLWATLALWLGAMCYIRSEIEVMETIDEDK